MARVFNVALEEHAAVTEKILALPLHGLERGHQRRLVVAARQADAATAGGGLEHQRVPQTRGVRHGLIEVGQQPGAGRERHPGGLGQRPRFVLQAEAANLLRRGADEHQPGLGAVVGKRGVLRQEAVAGNDRLGAGGARRVNHLVAAQITLRRRLAAQRHGFVSGGDVQAVAVGIGIHGDAGNAHGLQGAGNADGDFAAIGDQHFVKHGRRPSRWPGHARRP